ncbi:MAG TPA: PAS domain-containing protein, partial [Opitutus sp.]|nr:PAS domain-containing protein [Opitutus sp.]
MVSSSVSEPALSSSAAALSSDIVADALALRHSADAEFYRSVLESLGEGVMITDAQWRIQYAN